MVERDRQIIRHHIVASNGSGHGNLVERQPLLEIGFAIICVYPKDLETCRPLDGSVLSRKDEVWKYWRRVVLGGAGGSMLSGC